MDSPTEKSGIGKTSEPGMTPNGFIPMQHLTRREREHTPEPFARYLIDLVQARSVLWVCRESVYYRFGLDVWGIDRGRDANLYKGPGSIIAHPPCGPWGKLSWSSRESKSHGINAMRFVHLYGGVVEQPQGSQLFKEHGREGARIIWVNQRAFGHRAIKPTDLYVWPPPDADISTTTR